MFSGSISDVASLMYPFDAPYYYMPRAWNSGFEWRFKTSKALRNDQSVLLVQANT